MSKERTKEEDVVYEVIEKVRIAETSYFEELLKREKLISSLKKRLSKHDGCSRWGIDDIEFFRKLLENNGS